MIEIITWNVQGGLGADGRHSLERLARIISGLGDADIICLQEIAQYIPEIDGGHECDQIADLGRHFPAYEPVFGPAIDRPGKTPGRRRRFGNLILSRLPVLQIFLHPLPQPADSTIKHMPRQATEIVVDTGAGALRIMTTHLEFHSEAQRIAQVARLRTLHEEVCENSSRPGLDPGEGLYARVPRPPNAIFCGDYNFTPQSPAYAHMLAPLSGAALPLVDAWTTRHGDRPHEPTCGLFDHQQWPEGAHCRDFFFVTADLAARVDTVAVAQETNASDHQPVRLVLGDA